MWREIEQQQARCSTPDLLFLTCTTLELSACCPLRPQNATRLPPLTPRTNHQHPTLRPSLSFTHPLHSFTPKTNHHHHPTLRRSLCVMSLARGAGPSMASMTDLHGCVTLSSRSRRLYSSSW